MNPCLWGYYGDPVKPYNNLVIFYTEKVAQRMIGEYNQVITEAIATTLE